MGKTIIIIFLVTFSILSLFSGIAESYPEEILRIHIIANSNSPKDQFIKYKVRDAILDEFGKELEEISSKEDIEAFMDKKMGEIISTADNVLRENGFDYESSGEIGVFDFPTRLYLDAVHPSGQYNAVKLNLGKGAGDNWWCVMFPPLCLVGDVREDPSNTDHVDDGEIEVEFFVINWVKGIINTIKGIL